MAYSACMTDLGKKLLKKFLTQKRCLYVLDESVAIKTPRAKRTQRILGSARYAPYRRILTGTPITNGAFDVYAPIRFLNKDYWFDHGLGSYLIFKNYFGMFRDGYNGATGKSFRQLVAYKNLDELHDMLEPISTRVTKDEVLDLPPKLYSKRYVEMTPEQERLYNAIKNEYMVELESGAEINAPLAIVRLLRLQQIICGYVPDDDGNMVIVGGKNPRLETLIEFCNGLAHKAIIWARFRRDIDLITTALGKECVRYDGAVGTNDRAKAIEAFQHGETKFFVANPAAAGEGLTLHAARSVIYYNNSFKLSERMQSEDRAHRIGQEHPVHYTDFVCPGTVDERIVESLRGKRDVAQAITGDTLKEWL
jgi:SNF2 family DNA or RNA helicase